MDYWQYLALLFFSAFDFLILLIASGFHHVSSLLVTDIKVPEFVDFRNNVTLSCSYNMGGHKLNSVKWYKDGMEFFRFSPMTNPVFMKFTVNGVTIANEKYHCNYNTCQIELGQLTLKSSGAYRCEISGDAPEFKLTSRTENMTVAALPQYDPLINGVSPTYMLDDYVVANCSSDWSNPPSLLSWFINDEKASPEILQPQQDTTISTNEFNLHSRSLEIQFHIDQQRFMNSKGILQMRCVADINQVPALRRDKVINAFILSQNDLTNQKLINWRNSADRRFRASSTILCIDAIIILITRISFHMILLKDILR